METMAWFVCDHLTVHLKADWKALHLAALHIVQKLSGASSTLYSKGCSCKLKYSSTEEGESEEAVLCKSSAWRNTSRTVKECRHWQSHESLGTMSNIYLPWQVFVLARSNSLHLEPWDAALQYPLLREVGLLYVHCKCILSLSTNLAYVFRAEGGVGHLAHVLPLFIVRSGQNVVVGRSLQSKQ